MAFFPKPLLSLVQPAVYSLASRLFVLSTGRDGSKKFQPTISTFYETGIVTALYEQMLMCPAFKHLEIRHEMPYPGPIGAPKQVDLWSRHLNGAHPQLIEAGDFSVKKAHADLQKATSLNPKGANWFLGFFRGSQPGARDPWAVLSKSLGRSNGLKDSLVRANQGLTTAFEVYRPDGNHDWFGAALLRAL